MTIYSLVVVLFPNFELISCSISGSRCCFFTCVQISVETDKVAWYSHFPQFVVVHTVKGFRIVNEAEVDVFLEFLCFFYEPTNVGNLISDSSAFSKPNLIFGSSQFTDCCSLTWRILSITLLGSDGKESACSIGDQGSIPGLGRSPGERNGQYSCLENPMDRGAWPATVHGVAKSWTQWYN